MGYETAHDIMTQLSLKSASRLSPLERFVRDYVEARDGVWDEIEPGVYDLLIDSATIKVAFDPEALPEHPQAQLASLGSPLIDGMLNDAATRFGAARLYRIGLNLHPHDIESRVRRALTTPADATTRVDRVRALHFPQAIYWFKAIFTGDQKEEEIIPAAMDLHHLREVRHIEALLASDRLSIEPQAMLAVARHASPRSGYLAARERAARTAGALLNARRREWSSLVERQIGRMSAYYAQLRVEADEQATRTRSRGESIAKKGKSVGSSKEDGLASANGSASQGTVNSASATDLKSTLLESEARIAARLEAINREERLRIAELRQKSTVRASMKLASLMIVQQPKLLMHVSIVMKDRSSATIEVVWDPLTESIESVSCPRCGRPTFAFRVDRFGLFCETCPANAFHK